MARSIRKGPHIDMKLLKKVHKMEEASSKSVIKTWLEIQSFFQTLLDTLLLYTMVISLYLYLLQRIWLDIN